MFFYYINLKCNYILFFNLTLCWIWFKGRTIICGVISPGSIPGIQPEEFNI